MTSRQLFLAISFPPLHVFLLAVRSRAAAKSIFQVYLTCMNVVFTWIPDPAPDPRSQVETSPNGPSTPRPRKPHLPIFPTSLAHCQSQLHHVFSCSPASALWLLPSLVPFFFLSLSCFCCCHVFLHDQSETRSTLQLAGSIHRQFPIPGKNRQLSLVTPQHAYRTYYPLPTNIPTHIRQARKI